MDGKGHDDFRKVFAGNYARLLIFAQRYVRDRDAAEDIVMDALATAWINRHKLEGVPDILPYLYKTVKNMSLNWLDASRRHLAKQADMHSGQLRLVEANIRSLKDCDLDYLFSDEIRRLVMNTLKQLPDVTRDVFVYSRRDNMTYAEIAERMGIPLRRVTAEMQKALSCLRESLKDYLPLGILLIILDV